MEETIRNVVGVYPLKTQTQKKCGQLVCYREVSTTTTTTYTKTTLFFTPP